ncbi:hypothetical protein SAMN05446927_3301 [Caballeronia arationis]|jgi:hypothetical protein|uniref:Uncharacterized protein n=2 Tax=Caballeronia arationis TaxID=1777142 RepID=A0A7Z7I7I0_9BURK|nr:hypothetical protein [Caballeronia arationis]SOE67413.1 hypothetical protein SAMN05446927_3301 [Caballeronia arationis]
MKAAIEFAPDERRQGVEERPLHGAHNRSPFIEEEVDMETLNSFSARRVPWNKGRCQSKIEMSYRRLSTDVVFLVGCESCLQRFEFT